MNKQEVKKLLAEWTIVLEEGRNTSNVNAKEIKGDDPSKRIHRITGSPVIFDRQSFNRQLNIQKELYKHMPKQRGLIKSEPALGGFAWPISDYIHLYFDHYELVVLKLKEVLCCV